jgi:ketosteroid isomerase-like protein
MSHEDVEVAQRAFDAWNARDLGTLIGLADVDMEFMPFRSQLEGSAYRGPQGFRQFARDAEEEWEFVRVAAAEYRDAGTGGS